MGVLKFERITQVGVDPAPSYAPLNIEGIGEIMGGEINTETAVLTVTQIKTHVSTTNTTIRTGNGSQPGYAYPYGRYMRTIVSGYGSDLKSNVIPYAQRNNNFSNGMTSWIRPGVSAIVYWKHPDCATEEGAQALRTADIYFVYNLETPIEHHLTTAQLHQALDQLKSYMGGGYCP